MKITRFRFSLRSVLLLICLVGIALAYLGYVRRQRVRELTIVSQLQRKGRVWHISESTIRGGSADPSNFFGWWNRIIGIDLSDGAFGECDFRSLKELKHLRSISISRVPSLTDDVLIDVIRSHPTLEHLDINECPITDRSAPEIANLKNLPTLCLTFTGITDDGVACFADMEELFMLDLCGNRISDQCTWVFRELSQLEDLDISWTDVSLSAVEQLSRVRPDLSINATDAY